MQNKMTTLKSTYDTDVIRIIGQQLVNMGLRQTVEQLVQESGLDTLDHPDSIKLRQHILAGEWDKSNVAVEDVARFSTGDKQANIKLMKLVIAEQKYLELIEDNNSIKALRCLRLEITPFIDDVKKIRALAALLLCRSPEEVRQKANWLGKSPESRLNIIDIIQRFLPSAIMLPSKRLETLLFQAVRLQRERCSLHIENPLSKETIDLKSDHTCLSDKFPLHLKQQFDNHKAEVWYCKFSNDGTKLATGGIHGKVIIWDVDNVTQTMKQRCTLECSSYSISCLSWSPNDVYLLASGAELKTSEVIAHLWIWNVNKEEIHRSINHSEDETITTCSWQPAGKKFATASIKGNFNVYDLDGNRIASRDGLRVQCLSFLNKDSNLVLAADNQNRIRCYSIRDMSLTGQEEEILEERHPIMSFTIDHQDRYIAVNLMKQGVHLWDLKLKTIVRIFSGVVQRSFTIYSSFSNAEPLYLASGSEDGNVYIYHPLKDKPVAILEAHNRCVNCVTWNPKYPELLVSVSDDSMVRLWTRLPSPNLDKFDDGVQSEAMVTTQATSIDSLSSEH